MTGKGLFHSASNRFRSLSDKLEKRGKDESQKAANEDPEVFKKRTEEEKHFVAQCCDEHNKTPLSPIEIAKDPAEKHVGHSSKHLRCSDFKLVETLGTGTFARVWLAAIARPQQCDKDKVVALKVLKKVDVIKLKQVEHVGNERNILAAVAGHPFITTLVASFQDTDTLYMILDFCPGGEVFSYLRKARRFSESTSQFYAAEVVLIFEYLHHQEGVAYRDLKPENILLDSEGHLKLVDFGFAKKLNDRPTYTLCGTPEYLAPESIKNTGHTCAVDWWALGILVFEFLTGQPPFWHQNQMQMYDQICTGKIPYPTGMSAAAKDVIGNLCQVDPSHRLGNMPGGAKDVKAHPWFAHIEWKKLYNREITPPIKPHLTGPADTRNFDCYDDEPRRKSVYTAELQKKFDHHFAGF